MTDRGNGKKRDSGSVTFDDHASKDKTVIWKYHPVNGHNCEVKKFCLNKRWLVLYPARGQSSSGSFGWSCGGDFDGDDNLSHRGNHSGQGGFGSNHGGGGYSDSGHGYNGIDNDGISLRGGWNYKDFGNYNKQSLNFEATRGENFGGRSSRPFNGGSQHFAQPQNHSGYNDGSNSSSS